MCICVSCGMKWSVRYACLNVDVPVIVYACTHPVCDGLFVVFITAHRRELAV